MTRNLLSLLVIVSNWPAETFIERLLDGLLKEGVSVTLASVNKPASYWFDIPNFEWLPIHKWDESFTLRGYHFVWNFLCAFFRSGSDLRKMIARVNESTDLIQRLRLWHRLLPFVGRYWDVIYFPWNSTAIEHLPLFDLEMPVVISCRGSQINVGPYNPQRAELTEGLRKTFEQASLVHCVSKNISEEANKFGLDPQKARVIRPSVDPHFFLPLPAARQNRETFCILSTGSLIWVKGFEYALLAIQKLYLAGIPIQYNLIGSGVDEERIRFTINDLGLQSYVNLLGRQSPQQVCQLLQKSDVFLLPSLSEGISNAVLEAMSCGVPVVTTDCGGMREAVEDGVEGFVIPVRNVESMALALKRLWQYPAMREKMGNAGRQKVLRDFNVENQSSQWMDIFQQAVGSKVG